MRFTLYQKDDYRATIELTVIEAAEMMKALTEIKPTNIPALTKGLNDIMTARKSK